MARNVWKVKRAALAGDEGTRSLDRYLSEQWEPFAVTRDGQGEEYVHLRKIVREREEEKDTLLGVHGPYT